MKQWEERLKSFLEPIQGNLGLIGGGKRKPSYKIDIAVMQSLVKMENLGEVLDHYGQIIVDECHHLGAYSFESILKQAKAKYVLGLTATPIRRDGRYPIVTMQLGPIRHVVPVSDKKEMHMLFFPTFFPGPTVAEGTSIQEVFKVLSNDNERNNRIVEDVKRAYGENRNILVLTERTDHLILLAEAIKTAVPSCFVLHGRMTQKSRKLVLASFDKAEGPRVLLSTGRLIGEGFDKPILDTLFLALPISWKGTLAQYAGRLNRNYPGKTEVRIYDYIDDENKQLQNMFKKRQTGYKALGYSVVPKEKLTLFGNTE
jgi:superfamily II DNA or RNA helicase